MLDRVKRVGTIAYAGRPTLQNRCAVNICIRTDHLA